MPPSALTEQDLEAFVDVLAFDALLAWESRDPAAWTWEEPRALRSARTIASARRYCRGAVAARRLSAKLPA